MPVRQISADGRKILMINIAICDDDKTLTGVVEQLLYRLAAEHGIDIRCGVFFDGSSLIRAVTEQGMCFDLVYLDIEMETMNGICTAQTLRDMELPTLIVYLSGHEEYLKKLFDTEPFRFLSKPIIMKEFSTVFLSACERLQKRAGYFTFSYNKVIHKVPYNEITYFESNGRVISIHTAGKENTPLPQNRFYGKMNDIDRSVAFENRRFLRIHQSYLVNFDYIREFASTEVTMLDGKRLQISEDRRKTVRAKFCTLLGEEGKC